MNVPVPQEVRRGRAATAFLLVLVGWHLVQLVSPLRLNTDALRLLMMAISADAGDGFKFHGAPDPLPKGYPTLVMGLLEAGLNSTPWLNALNLLSALGGCAIFYRLLRAEGGVSPGAAALLTAWPLLSWVLVKHAMLPLTESVFLLISMTAVWALQRAWRAGGSERWGWLAVALGVSLEACTVRTIGIALFPALVLTAVWHPASRAGVLQWLPRTRLGWMAVSAALLVAGTLGAVAYRHSLDVAAAQGNSYQSQQLYALRQGAGTVARQILTARMTEWGEILLNVPATRLGRAALLAPMAGVVAGVLLVLGLGPLVRRFPPLAFYFIFYGFILFLWPYYDTRFWLPVLPLLGLCGWLGLARLRVPRLTAAYFAGFAALGMGALVFSTRLSLAGVRFADLYGDGTHRPSYRAAFGLPYDGEADPDVIAILRKFEPLAKGPAAARHAN